MGVIRRSFSYLSCDLFKRLYATFVRPHLEYAQVVWAPHLQKYVNMIENVQIRATKLVDGFKDLEYAERLRRLDLPTLLHRRKRGDMIEMWKHFHVYDRDTVSPSFRPRSRSSRKHDYQVHSLVPKDGTRGLQSNSFYFRNADVWNSLPKHVVDAKNINSFKTLLDKHWQDAQTIFDHRPQSDP